MKSFWIRFSLSCKRQLKYPFYFGLLFVTPIFCLCFRLLSESSQPAGFSSALFCENPDPLTEAFLAVLIEETKAPFSFFLVSSENELRELVQNETINCGYQIPNQLTKRLDSGEIKQCITIYESPNSSFTTISNELVFAALFSQYGAHSLKQYLQNADFFETLPPDILAQAESLYESHRTGDTVFHAKFENLDSSLSEPSSDSSKYPPQVIRGFLAILLMISGFLGGIHQIQNKKRNLPFPAAFTIFIPIFLFFVPALLSLWISGLIQNLLFEIMALLFYSFFLTVILWILIQLIPNEFLISAAIPFFTLGSLLFCPIFLDLSTILPALTFLKWLFFPTYYLLGF